MKKTTFFNVKIGLASLAIMTGFTVHAQSSLTTGAITITESDMPQMGSYYVTATDSAPSVTQGSAGASQTWNLSAIKNDGVDTLYALSPSVSAYASYFPGTNLMLRTDVVGAGETDGFATLNADSLTVSGTALPYSSYLFLGFRTPGVVGFSFPLTYNTNWHGTYIDVEKASLGGGDSSKGVTLYAYSDTVDAWGSVTTPAGTFNALRVKSIFKPIYDSNYFDFGTGWTFVNNSPLTKTETYSWYANGEGIDVAQIIMDSLGGTVSSANYLLKVATGIKTITNNASVQVYPDPASSVINITIKAACQNGYIQILDLTGREIENSFFTNGKAQFNTSGYASGMYLYLITDANGNLLDKGKFSVIH